MSKEKFRLENKLGTSGVITSIILVITTMIIGLLFSISFFFRFVLHDSIGMREFLEAFGIEDANVHETFDISQSISWLGSTTALITLMVLIVCLLIIWVLFYKLNSVYAYRAFRGYGLSLLGVSGILLVFGVFVSVFVYNVSKEAYFDYENAFKVGKWLLVFSVIPVFALGLLMLLVSLFAAFPAKTDMRRPRRNGEKDVSFIMDDEEIGQIYEDSLSYNESQKSSEADSEEHTDNVLKVEAEIVQRTCSNCGCAVKDSDIFCVECGAKLQ